MFVLSNYVSYIKNTGLQNAQYVFKLKWINFY